MKYVLVAGKYETNLEPDKGMSKRRKWNWCGGDYFDSRCKFDPLFWGGYCVYRVKMCGQILQNTQRKVKRVYAVKEKSSGRGCSD